MEQDEQFLPESYSGPKSTLRLKPNAGSSSVVFDLKADGQHVEPATR
jgi:hypothetical protein